MDSYLQNMAQRYPNMAKTLLSQQQLRFGQMRMKGGPRGGLPPGAMGSGMRPPFPGGGPVGGGGAGMLRGSFNK